MALFVTNVLNGTVAANGKEVDGGTIVRLLLSISDDEEAPALLDSTVIADRFPERTDPAALVIGPTGVAFDGDTGTLYVADSLDNRIAAVPEQCLQSRPNGVSGQSAQRPARTCVHAEPSPCGRERQ